MTEQSDRRLAVEVSGSRVKFGPHLSIEIQRTLRIPQNHQVHGLPAGLGAFPVRRVEDVDAPEDMRARGGIVVPVYEREALWLRFKGHTWHPTALQVAAGMVNAVSGKAWEGGEGVPEPLTSKDHENGQNYMVVPPQPWLDGIVIQEGQIRQFIAARLGQGVTVEAQVTGEEKFGGIQLIAFDAVAGRFPDTDPSPPPFFDDRSATLGGGGMMKGGGGPMSFDAGITRSAMRGPSGQSIGATSMGLGAGGRMRQKIYTDPYGIATWDLAALGRCFIHLVSAEDWRAITGEEPPKTPCTRAEYERNGIPWFELSDEGAEAVAGGENLGAVKTVAEMDKDKGTAPIPADVEDLHVEPGKVKNLGDPTKAVSDRAW